MLVPKIPEPGFGSLQGQIILSDDWDSDETNEEIARLFLESEIFPNDDPGSQAVEGSVGEQ